VRARIEREGRGVAFASVIDVLTPSPSRRPAADPGCGGHVYAHIAYADQPAIKRAVVLDALAHGGRLRFEGDLPVHASSEHGYRMRARLHVRHGRIGFFREGTHDICRAAASGQLLDATVASLDGLAAALPRQSFDGLDALELSENITGDERAVHLVWAERARPGLARGLAFPIAGITGVSAADPVTGLPRTVAGEPSVSDAISALLPRTGAGAGSDARIRRHAPSFFQANRYLLPELVSSVVRHAGPGPVVDFYAGVGLFALSIAAAGGGPVVAVEGDPISGSDLSANAAQFDGLVQVERAAVEDVVGRRRLPDGATLIVDPPRTGMSRAALDGVIAARAPRIVYVSCDVATLARDLRRLLDAGYGVEHLEAFDLFPNTAHVETVAVLERRQGA
jgi:23S rRNA (uracil1939-C5)-methyltransferase